MSLSDSLYTKLPSKHFIVALQELMFRNNIFWRDGSKTIIYYDTDFWKLQYMGLYEKESLVFKELPPFQVISIEELLRLVGEIANKEDVNFAH